MARQPKVFVWSDGFHAWTVAASSRAKATEAWGFERDPFKDGAAREIADGDDYAAALAEPGVPIKRGLAVDIGQVERAPRPKPVKPKAPTGPSRADREQVARLEADLAALERAQANDVADLDRRRADLEREAAALKRTQTKARDALEARLKAARDRLGLRHPPSPPR